MLQALRDATNRKSSARTLERQLDHARFLLTHTSEPLAAVAAGCGWRSETAFVSEFERLVGVTPEFYRRWHQSRFL